MSYVSCKPPSSTYDIPADLKIRKQILFFSKTFTMSAAWLSRKSTVITLDDVSGTAAQKKALANVAREFELNTDKLRVIVKQFQEEMQKGLSQYGATVAMIPSYVVRRPTGNETGKYLALDLGGTNLRVCEIHLQGEKKSSIQHRKFVVSDELKTGEMRKLCDFIAECVDSFITEGNAEGEYLGYTFSFPVQQQAINRGTLMHWTKGFNCSGAVGKDVVAMLQDAFNRKLMNIKVAALVNDTVGTLMAQGYSEPDTFMGVIFGTGTNACYYEKVSNIIKWEKEKDAEAPENMIINMEWGAFDNERRVLPITKYDNKLDRESINPNGQIYEKMISGLYLGEIARNIMLDLIDQDLLFGGRSSPEMNKHFGFDTAYMSAIIADESNDLTAIGRIFESDIGIPNTTLTDRQITKKICELVGVRASRLSGSGLAAVLAHTGMIEQGCTIAIDGSVFEHYPSFKANMEVALSELFGPPAEKVNMTLAKDGSGLGAGIIAALSGPGI